MYCFVVVLYFLRIAPLLRTSFVVPWVRVSNPLYASLRLLKAGNSGGLFSRSLSVFLSRFHFRTRLPVRGSNPTSLRPLLAIQYLMFRKMVQLGGKAHQFCRPSPFASADGFLIRSLQSKYACLQGPICFCSWVATR